MSKVAENLVVGGHYNASGCTIDMLDVEKAKRNCIKGNFLKSMNSKSQLALGISVIIMSVVTGILAFVFFSYI